MKEFNQHLFQKVKNGEKTPKRAIQELSARAALYWYWRIDKLSPEAKEYFSSHLSKAISSGEKLSLSELAENLLGGFSQEKNGQGYIPKDGPLVIIANHWKKGPMHGMWSHSLISKAVKDARTRNDEVHWMMQDALELRLRTPFGQVAANREMPVSAYVISEIAQTFDLTIVTAPFKIDRSRLNGRKRTDFKLPVSTFRELSRVGGVVGVYPEAGASDQLIPAWWGSEMLIRRIAQVSPDAQAQPVGVFSENKNLILNFGQPLPIGKVVEEKDEPHNYLMAKVADLMPQKFKGYYTEKIPR